MDRDKKRLYDLLRSYHWLIKAFRTYLGFHYQLNNTYPGVNALTLGFILIDLANRFEDKRSGPEIAEIRKYCRPAPFSLAE
jgi:hypothetical protein